MENLLNKNNVLDFYNLNDDLNILNIISDLLFAENLNMYCKNIKIDNSDKSFSYYSYIDQMLYLNYDKLYNCFMNSFNSKFITNINILRIVFHEIIHIYQFKMMDKNLEKAKIFKKEFNSLYFHDIKYLPMEVNADILSSINILILINHDRIMANQLLWTYKIICEKYKYGNPCDLIEFNEKQIYDTDFDKLIYGISINDETIYKIFFPYLDDNIYKKNIIEKIFVKK